MNIHLITSEIYSAAISLTATTLLDHCSSLIRVFLNDSHELEVQVSAYVVVKQQL
jgi:hypothetical protein